MLDRATARRFTERPDPVHWRGHLDKLLSAPVKATRVEHHDALPVDQAPGFMARLRTVPSPALATEHDCVRIIALHRFHMAPHLSTLPAGLAPVGSLTISRRSIDVWLSHYDRIEDEALLSDMWQLLNPAEREQSGRFYFADDRKRYLVTRAMVRTVLSRYAAVAPGDWMFSANAHGRPEIANTHDEARGLRFNLSHTRGLIALAVTRDREVGVDVENLRARSAPLDIADRFFSRTEAAALAAVSAEQRQDRFFEYWTLKESYIKARGQGLSIPLDRFGFTFPQAHTVQLNIDAALGDDVHRWSFWQMSPSAGYLLALCAERLHGEASSLTVRSIVPLQREEPLSLAVLKTSDAAGAHPTAVVLKT